LNAAACIRIRACAFFAAPSDLAEHALTVVAVDDALIVDEVGCSFGERALRHAGGAGLLLQVGEEAVESHAVVAGGRTRGGSGNRTGRRCRGSD
jgi:hypothetical protein